MSRYFYTNWISEKSPVEVHCGQTASMVTVSYCMIFSDKASRRGCEQMIRLSCGCKLWNCNGLQQMELAEIGTHTRVVAHGLTPYCG
jgi:hypothetical protein